MDTHRRSSHGSPPRSPQPKEYCRFCLIKFEARFMIPIFTTETKRLEEQIRAVLQDVEMQPEDKYSNCICIECAMKISNAFNFMQFCDENQKLLKSSHFHVDLLVEATDTPEALPLEPMLDLPPPATSPQRESPETTRLTSPSESASNRVKRRKTDSPNITAQDERPLQQSPTQTQPSPVPRSGDEDAEEDQGMALSTMLECQLNDTEDVDDEEQAPKNLDLPVPLEGGLPPNNPYKCTVCFREFGKKANVLSHFQTQHTSLEVPSAWKYEIEPAKCPLCGELVECLFAHLEFHAQRRTFKCDKCEWAFYSKNYLNIHTSKLHKADAAIDAKPDRYACKLCTPVGSKVCQDYDELVGHYRQWHLNEMKNKAETCQLCGKETRYLKQHMEKVHGSGDGQKREFQCHLCDKSYGQMRYLQTHFTVAHKDQQPKASMPPPPPLTDFSAMANQHPPQVQPMKVGNPTKKSKTNFGPPVHCVKCQMQFPSNRMLNMHIQRYHIANANSPPTTGSTTTRAELSVTAIPTGAGMHPPLHVAHENFIAGSKKRRRDSVPAAMANIGPPKDMWNNSALTGMLVNMFGMHGHYET